MPDTDRERWNARYAERADAIREPDGFLLEVERQLPHEGRALDLAGGTGRHALWLARRGLDVTLLDVADEALAIASARADAEGLALTCLQSDLTERAPPAGPWDLLVSFHYLQRDLFPRFPALLAPGGLLLFAQPTVCNLERHDRPSRRFLLAEGEISDLVEGLAVLHLDEGWSAAGRHEVRLLAQRPDA